MTLREVRDTFLKITENCYHYEAWEEKDSYIVWAEDGQADATYSDDKMQTQVVEGTLDLYTKQEYDPLFEKCQATMNDCESMTWRLNSIQHEEETDYIHYEWVWQIAQGIGDVVG